MAAGHGLICGFRYAEILNILIFRVLFFSNGFNSSGVLGYAIFDCEDFLIYCFSICCRLMGPNFCTENDNIQWMSMTTNLELDTPDETEKLLISSKSGARRRFLQLPIQISEVVIFKHEN